MTLGWIIHHSAVSAHHKWHITQPFAVIYFFEVKFQQERVLDNVLATWSNGKRPLEAHEILPGCVEVEVLAVANWMYYRWRRTG
jgi:hypothetical protein